MIEDHKQIWLEPLSEDDDYVYGDRTWCQDDVWDSNDYNGVHATKYIRADLAEFQISELEGRVRELEVVVEQAANIGVDFGYGPFELEQDHIERARKLLQPHNGE